jgi:radical SAM protein (TIGR01212 family)
MTVSTPYSDFGNFLSRKFPFKVQKISVGTGGACPNRDGLKGVGGCSYCNNRSFSPNCENRMLPVSKQLDNGVRFFARKYPAMKYLAYFQSYTNTYGEISGLISKYEEAAAYPGVVGLIIGTRPDCMPDELLEYFARLSRRTFLLIEYGVESTLDRTLAAVNRGHLYADSVDAISRTAGKGIYTGAHIILGLPGESKNDMLAHADRLSELPLTSLKLHQLQIIKATAMAAEYKAHPQKFRLFSLNEYIDLCIDFAERLNPSIAIERFVSQSPKSLLVAPDWGVKNYEFTAQILRRFRERDTWQGRNFQERTQAPDK